MKEIFLEFPSYKLFEYEKHLAIKEIKLLLKPKKIKKLENGFNVETSIQNFNTLKSRASKLTYFHIFVINNKTYTSKQKVLEQTSTKNIRNKQQTRYGAHGLHEYKGKFNPQIVSSLINILDLNERDKVIDPFCGSGTTLLECSYKGINATGFDLNPLATFIANTKTRAHKLDFSEFEEFLFGIKDRFKHSKLNDHKPVCQEREKYLKSWFKENHYEEVEKLKNIIESVSDKELRNVLFCCASNILRDYSLQEPADLRIRRRKSNYPSESFIDRFISLCLLFSENAKNVSEVYKVKQINKAFNIDIRDANATKKHGGYTAAITSPPYATALPYIDTQRLSLIWLGYTDPKETRKLEHELIGSREISKKNQNTLNESLSSKDLLLPKELQQLCVDMNSSLGNDDGFRRQAMPSLMYRYFLDMQNMFNNVHKMLKKGGTFALVVGHNQTTLGGKTFLLDTPSYLTQIAEFNGWDLEESLPLETYQRYGLHSNNAIKSEQLILLRSR